MKRKKKTKKRLTTPSSPVAAPPAPPPIRDPRTLATPFRAVRTLTGHGRRGLVDGPPRSSLFHGPTFACIVRARAGGAGGAAKKPGDVVVVSDTENHCVRLIQAHTGRVTTSRARVWLKPAGIAEVQDGKAVLVCDAGHHKIKLLWLQGPRRGRAVPLAGSGKRGHRDGAALHAEFAEPTGICVAPDGSVIVADKGNHCIRRIAYRGQQLWVHTLAGGGASRSGLVDGLGRAARFQFPMALVVDANGRVLLSDKGNNCLRALLPPPPGMDKQWRVVTIAGDGDSGAAGCVDGVSDAARFNSPGGLCFSADGEQLLVADTGNHCIRVVAAEMLKSTPKEAFVRRRGEKSEGDGIAGAGSGDVAFVAATRRAYAYVSSLTGYGGQAAGASAAYSPGHADGDLASSRFRSPTDLITRPADGALLVCDTRNNMLRLLRPTASMERSVAAARLTSGTDAIEAQAGRAGTSSAQGLKSHAQDADAMKKKQASSASTDSSGAEAANGRWKAAKGKAVVHLRALQRARRKQLAKVEAEPQNAGAGRVGGMETRQGARPAMASPRCLSPSPNPNNGDFDAGMKRRDGCGPSTPIPRSAPRPFVNKEAAEGMSRAREPTMEHGPQDKGTHDEMSTSVKVAGGRVRGGGWSAPRWEEAKVAEHPGGDKLGLGIGASASTAGRRHRLGDASRRIISQHHPMFRAHAHVQASAPSGALLVSRRGVPRRESGRSQGRGGEVEDERDVKGSVRAMIQAALVQPNNALPLSGRGNTRDGSKNAVADATRVAAGPRDEGRVPSLFSQEQLLKFRMALGENKRLRADNARLTSLLGHAETRVKELLEEFAARMLAGQDASDGDGGSRRASSFASSSSAADADAAISAMSSVLLQQGLSRQAADDDSYTEAIVQFLGVHG